jgi:hypothetical protein
MLALSRTIPCDAATTQTFSHRPAIRQTPTGELSCACVARSPVSDSHCNSVSSVRAPIRGFFSSFCACGKVATSFRAAGDCQSTSDLIRVCNAHTKNRNRNIARARSSVRRFAIAARHLETATQSDRTNNRLRKTEQHLRDAHSSRVDLRFYSERNLLQSSPGAAAMLHRIALVSGGSAQINSRRMNSALLLFASSKKGVRKQCLAADRIPPID